MHFHFRNGAKALDEALDVLIAHIKLAAWGMTERSTASFVAGLKLAWN